MLVRGTKWSTWQSVVSQQTGTICHKMDSSMWQTIGTISFIHSFREWLPPILSCGHAVISRLRFCSRSWRLKINIRRRFVHLSRSVVHVQEANVSIPQLNRIRNHIAGCWFAYGWFTCARLMGSGYWSAGNDSRNTKTNPSEHQSTTKIKQVLDQNEDLSNIDQVPSNAHLSDKESQLCIFEDTGYLTESNWTPQVQIKYVESKNQLADILTKGSFTSDEWHNLWHLFS